MAVGQLFVNVKNNKNILTGIGFGLDVRYDLKAPKNWAAVYAKLNYKKVS
jgi:hypothetical protein